MNNQTQFQVGQIYFGSAPCAHGSLPVRCIKKTAKCVVFEHVSEKPLFESKRSKVRTFGEDQMADFHGFMVSSDAKDNSFDALTV